MVARSMDASKFIPWHQHRSYIVSRWEFRNVSRTFTLRWVCKIGLGMSTSLSQVGSAHFHCHALLQLFVNSLNGFYSSSLEKPVGFRVVGDCSESWCLLFHDLMMEFLHADHKP